MDMEPNDSHDIGCLGTAIIIVVIIISIITSLPEMIMDVFKGLFQPTLEDWRTK